MKSNVAFIKDLNEGALGALNYDTNNVILDVSIIIPSFNSASSVDRALESVYNQNCVTREIIVIDDFSETNDYNYLVAILNKWQKMNLNILLHRNLKNMGPGSSRNVGVKLASGKYIAFLDADDVWHKNKLMIQYKIMENQNLHLSGHIYIPKLHKWESIENQLRSNSFLHIKDFIYKNLFATPTVMVKRDAFLLFPEGCKYAEDYYCWIRNVGVGRSLMINLPLAAGFKNSFGEGGLSKDLIQMTIGINEIFTMLYYEGVVTRWQKNLAVTFEYIKFVSRVFRIIARRFLVAIRGR